MKRMNQKRKAASADPQPVNKAARLIKRLVTRLGIIVAVIAVLAGMMLLAMNMQDSSQEKRDKAKSALDSIRNQTNSLNKQIEDLGAASQTYADLAEMRNNMEFKIQPRSIRDLVGRMKETYFITTLNLAFSDQTAIDLSELNSDEMEAVVIRGNMNLGGLSDHYIYQFMEALRKDFPGIVEMKRVSMGRRQPINIDVLSQISRGNAIETVSGEIQFDWYGFIEKPEAESEEESE